MKFKVTRKYIEETFVIKLYASPEILILDGEPVTETEEKINN